MNFILKYIKQRYKLRDYRFSLIFLVITLSVIGIFMVRSARPDLMDRQIMGVALGAAAMLVISLIDYKWVLSLYWPLYILNIIMLVAVFFFGTEVNGAKRWLDLGFTQFQPSDLTKILMILFYAKFLMEREQSIKNPKTILQGIALILPSLALIYKQPNLSTTLCIAALFCALMYLGGLSYKLIGTVLAVIIPTFVIVLVIAIQPNQPFLQDYQQERILAWLDPEEYADDGAYQQLNSVMAIGSGQLSGKGYDNDDTTSVKNGNFVRLYSDWFESERYGRSNYLWRHGRTGRDTELYQYRCGDDGSSEHGNLSPLRELWTDFRCVLFYGNRFRTECRFTA